MFGKQPRITSITHYYQEINTKNENKILEYIEKNGASWGYHIFKNAKTGLKDENSVYRILNKLASEGKLAWGNDEKPNPGRSKKIYRIPTHKDKSIRARE